MLIIIIVSLHCYYYICVVKSANTALMWAASNGHLPIVQYLAEQGAALDMADNVRAGEDIYAVLY